MRMEWMRWERVMVSWLGREEEEAGSGARGGLLVLGVEIAPARRLSS